MIYDYFEDRYVTVALSRTELEHLIARVPQHDLWMTFFRDTEGNLLALMSGSWLLAHGSGALVFRKHCGLGNYFQSQPLTLN